jgi:hypothetical protein
LAKQTKVQIVTPAGIAAYSYFHRADTKGKYANNKFKGDLVIDGSVDMSSLEKTLRDFAEAAFPGQGQSEDLKLPWSTWDNKEKNEEWIGSTILKASSKFAPKIVDTKRKPLPKGIEARSGDEVRFVCTLYAYEKTEKVKEGKKLIDVTFYGVSLQLQVVQLIKKNAGGGGLDALDDIEGFDAEVDGADYGFGDDAGGSSSDGEDGSDNADF